MTAQAPPIGPPLVLNVTVLFPADGSGAAQNLTEALLDYPEAIFYPVIAADGQINVTDVQQAVLPSGTFASAVAAGPQAGAAIESAPPLPPGVRLTQHFSRLQYEFPAH